MKTYVLKKSSATPDFRVDYDAELNGEQLAVVKGGDGPCLVLAGAGSGKTRTIVYRVSYLLEKGVPTENILLLTFTNKAAREMLERVTELIGAEPARMWGGTFHHVCHRILRQSGERVGLRPGFTIMDAEDAKDLLKVCVRDCGIDPKARRFPSPAVLLDLISYSHNAKMLLPEAVEAKHPNFLEIAGQIEDVAAMYLRRKRSANALDFDDILLLVLRLFESDAEARARYASQFRYILVDEYQDTNHVQAEIVRLLASVHGNVLVVGDDAQSIYSFRGADIRNILDFPRLFPGAKTFRLETNYRSTPEILALANDVISRNANQFPKELKSVKPSFAKPQAVTAVSAAQEAEFVAQRVLELRDEGTALRGMAVLFRATHHSQSLEFELMKRGIPYDYRGGMKFFDRAHVKDALAFMKIMVNKDDQVAWLRALSLQIGIGGVTAAKIFERVRVLADHESVVEGVDGLPAKAAVGWRDFLALYRELLRARPSPAAMLRAVSESDEYRRYLETEYPDHRDRVSDIEELANFAERYEEADQFLADATLRDDMGVGKRKGQPDDEREDRMVLSTIHQAKGLEWDAVFVVHMTQGSFPNKRALLDEGGLEEERRLFYVAVTRARRELYLTHPQTVGYDDFNYEAKSEFLVEIDPRLVETVGIEESYDDLPTVQLDEHGEPIKRKGMLKDVSDYGW